MKPRPNRFATLLLIFLLSAFFAAVSSSAQPSRSKEYENAQKRLARGWNTWNTQSVLSHVLLPQGFAINLGLKVNSYHREAYLREAVIGRNDEIIRPGAHAYDGSYTDLTLTWRKTTIRVQSATQNGELVLLLTPLSKAALPSSIVVESAFLWNRGGTLSGGADRLTARLPGKTVTVYATKRSVKDFNLHVQTPHLILPLDSEVGVSIDRYRSINQIKEIVAGRKAEYDRAGERFGELAETVNAIQSGMAWNTIYDPVKDRVISPVAQNWNKSWSGFVLFCWDTFFAGYLAAVNNKDLAYANVIEMLREKTQEGFVPNYAEGKGQNSLDKSQPPVGSIAVLHIYKKYKEKWLLRDAFEDLLGWNRWWIRGRLNGELLSWGSNPTRAPWTRSDATLNTLQAAKWESGLDNSHMYDDVPYDDQRHVMELSDVGLNSLYVADCDALGEIAEILGRRKEAVELKARANLFRDRLSTLWSEKDGMFLNRRTDTGEFSRRISPTNFYPLLAKAATPEQASRMINEHLLNPAEFWGEYVIPSTPRNDPAFKDQDYWRGRVWAPMNVLVYLGLRNYEFPEVRKELARKSKQLLLKEWRDQGHIHENYNAITGQGDDVKSSSSFYHWGALLGLIAVIEDEKLHIR